MPVTAGYRQYILDQLAPFGPVTTERLFGGVGLYLDEVIFGLIFNDQLYFKTDDASRTEYLRLGMQGFRTHSRKRAPKLRMSYYTVPVEVIENPTALAGWARTALAVANLRRK